MKIRRKSKSKLDAIGQAVKKGLPLAGIVGTVTAATAIAASVPPLSGERVVVGKMPRPETTVSIDVMSLHHRRFSTPGISYPRPLNFVVESYAVAEGDTWETLAKKHKVTLEIMLRINGVKPEKVYAILDGGGKVPPELALKVGQRIKVPAREIR